jgi:uncharacterized protein (DUF697 family)
MSAFETYQPRAARRTDSPLTELQEIELAAELLDIATEAELEQFLGKLIDGAAQAVGGVMRSPVGRALGGALKGVAKAALPLVGGALGSVLVPGLGTVVGSKLGSLAGGLFETEFENMGREEAEFEAARRVVRFSASAAKHAALAPPSAPPAAVVRGAVVSAARRHAPGLVRGSAEGEMPATIAPQATLGDAPHTGRWVRRSRNVLVMDDPWAVAASEPAGLEEMAWEREGGGATDVVWVQRSLNQVMNAGLAEDGQLGPLTRAAIMAFQRSRRLGVDGIVGPMTMAALQAALAAAPPSSRPGAPAGGDWIPAPATGDFPVAWSDGPVRPPVWSPKTAFHSSITCGGQWIPEHLQPEFVSDGWTARANAIVDIIRGPLFGWTSDIGGEAKGASRTGHVTNSYHYCGRAIDVFPPDAVGTFPAVGETLRRGWRLANWAAHDAARHSVAEVIFYDRIWTADRSSEGWRPYTHPPLHPGETGDPDTLQHRDHVHISCF